MNRLRDAWRSRWWGMSAAWAVCLVGWTVTYVLPDVYEARASVYVNTASALPPLLKGLAVQSDITSQVDLVRQVLLSRDVLDLVAEQAHVYRPDATPDDKQVAILGMRQRLHISSGSDARDRLYAITYRDRDRDRAVEVVAHLLAAFIEKTLGSSRTVTAAAEKFLVEQKEEYERRLAAAEDRLADFRRTNMGFLPGERMDYFTRLQTEMDLRTAAERALDQAREQRDEIRKQLSGERAGGVAATGGTPGVNPAGDGMATTSIDRRIQEAEDKLAGLRMLWTDRHPEVVSQTELVERLRAERRKYYASLGKDSGPDGSVTFEGNPVYQSLRLALNQAELKIVQLTSEIRAHSRTVDSLERQANIVPRVEADYQKLNRDYAAMNAQYQEVVKSLETARLSGDAAHKEEVDFRIIEPATAGHRPVAPKRLLFIPGIFVAALAIGVWTSVLRSRLTPVIYVSEDLSGLVSLPVLGIIGNTSPDLMVNGKRRSTYKFAGSFACLFVALCVAWSLPFIARLDLFSFFGSHK